MKTKGEHLFARYLSAHGMQFEHEPQWPHTGSRPDFRIDCPSTTIIADVKDLLPIEISATTFDPYEPIRNKIEAVRRQLRDFKSFCCCLVLFNAGHLRAWVHDPLMIYASMEGDLGFSIAVSTDTGEMVAGSKTDGFFEGGKMKRPRTKQPQNQTISAIVTVRELDLNSLDDRIFLEENPDCDVAELFKRKDERPPRIRPCIIVFENRTARIPLPRDIFNGPFDLRYSATSRGIERTFLGDGLAQYLGLF